VKRERTGVALREENSSKLSKVCELSSFVGTPVLAGRAVYVSKDPSGRFAGLRLRLLGDCEQDAVDELATGGRTEIDSD
jgi:hypothetical protein